MSIPFDIHPFVEALQNKFSSMASSLREHGKGKGQSRDRKPIPLPLHLPSGWMQVYDLKVVESERQRPSGPKKKQSFKTLAASQNSSAGDKNALPCTGPAATMNPRQARTSGRSMPPMHATPSHRKDQKRHIYTYTLTFKRLGKVTSFIELHALELSKSPCTNAAFR